MRRGADDPVWASSVEEPGAEEPVWLSLVEKLRRGSDSEAPPARQLRRRACIEVTAARRGRRRLVELGGGAWGPSGRPWPARPGGFPARRVREEQLSDASRRGGGSSPTSMRGGGGGVRRRPGVEEERSAEAWRRSGQSERSGWGKMRRKNVGVGVWEGRARACYSFLRV
jgi:hypothetical protein